MSGAHILVVDDEPDIRDLVREILEDEGYKVATAESAEAARGACRDHEPDLVLLDIWMPGDDGISLLKRWKHTERRQFPVIMMSGHGTVETAVEATRLGALDFIEKPLSLARLLLVVGRALESRAAEGAASAGGGLLLADEFIGSGAAIRQLREQAEKLAATSAPLVISGAPGSGKRTLARTIHALGERAQGPFLDVDAGRLEGPEGDAILLGCAQPARVGLLEQARGGSLFLHGIEVLGHARQSLLLDVLSSGSFTPIGGQSQSLDVRLIAASAADLPRMVERGALREELYYRLATFQLRVPMLSEHREDVPELLEYYVNWFVKRDGLAYRHFNVAAQNRLRHYEWPGNIAELRNLVQRLMILGQGAEIDVAEVEAALQAARERVDMPAGVMQLPLGMPLRQAREEFERAYLEQQLRAVGGSISELARIAGMERTHLYRKLRSLGIEHQKLR